MSLSEETKRNYPAQKCFCKQVLLPVGEVLMINWVIHVRNEPCYDLSPNRSNMLVTVKARFIGRDSLGYKRGETYNLIIEDNTIRRVEDNEGRCPYGSVSSFLNNWTDVRPSRYLETPTV
jgi:hypothetical protein